MPSTGDHSHFIPVSPSWFRWGVKAQGSIVDVSPSMRPLTELARKTALSGDHVRAM